MLCAARLSASQNVWTGAAGDNRWTNAANWSLAALPDYTQDVVIQDTGGNAVALTAPVEVGSLILGSLQGSATLNITGGALQCDGAVQIQTNSLLNLAGDLNVWMFQVDGEVNWTGGTLSAWSSTTIGSSGHLTIGALSNVLSGAFFNNGTVTCFATNLVANSGMEFTNNNLLVLHTNLALTAFSGVYPFPSFCNLGTILVPAGAGVVALTPNYMFLNQGTLQADTNAVLEVRPGGFSGLVFQDGTVFEGAGLVRFTGGGNFSCSGTMLVNGTVELADSSGYGLMATWTGPGLFRWLGGGLDSFAFGPDFHVDISGTGDKYLSGTCTNLGSVRWLGASSLHAIWGSPAFANGGIFTIEADCNWDPLIALANLPGGLVRQVAGQASFGNFSNSGMTDFSSGVLSVSGFDSAPASTCRWTLSGPSPGAGYSPLYAGSLGLDGALVVALTNGFTPASGSSFVLATNLYRNGSFATVSLPVLSSNLSWRVRYDANAVTLKVIPPPLLSSGARLADGSFQFRLTGGEGSGYELQTSTNLGDWITLNTNGPFTGTLTLSDTNAAQFGRRFYRARIAE